ncbi:hypothetical protein AN7524.2 [Aspergillus nidulans FGSC A4]|nr:hypothetical protein AN7524.2 [Aspergillus nidulans FGSC A4]|eukprot:XP_680793.1 hypothetical protein AN7524.2 [Aspergillus nidulans FGSC A4]
MALSSLSIGVALTPTVVSTLFSHYANRKTLHNKPNVHLSYDEGISVIREFIDFSSKRPIEYIQEFTAQRVPAPHWVRIERVSVAEEFLSESAALIIKQLGPRGVAQVGGEKWWQWRGPSGDKNNGELRGEWIEMHSDYNARKHAAKTDSSNRRIMLYIHGGAYYFGSVQTHRYQLQRHARKLKGRVFARIVKDNPGDYIPPHGFLHKPSLAWPPPNEDEIREINEALKKNPATTDKKNEKNEPPTGEANVFKVSESEPTLGHGRRPPSFVMNGKTIEVKDQIHMYTTNELLFHPLVSPIFQPSLGGLPPLQIISGGGEMLRDEQFYIAHKAANPVAYPPNDSLLAELDPKREIVNKYPGTYVQLQVWDDLCHVAPILSFTRPAKYMFRSIAQFGAWALARAQDTTVDIVNDDEVSPISSSESASPETSDNEGREKGPHDRPGIAVGKAGDSLPPFKDRMIRQRVDKRGHIYPLPPPRDCPALQLPPSSVGTINPGLLMKWMLVKEEWDQKFAKEKARIHQLRLAGLASGFQDFDGDTPPPSALAARRFSPGALPPKGLRTSYPMTMWARFATKHDKRTIKREQEMDSRSQRSNRASVDAGRAGASIEHQETKDKAASIPTEPAQQLNDKVPYSKPPSNDNKPTDSNPSLAQASSNKSFVPGPFIVLPNYEGPDKSENASTRALFHVPGTIKPTAQTAGTSKSSQDLDQRPSSQGGSATIRSGFTVQSDPVTDDAGSTIGDEKSLAVTTLGGVDAASTRAVLNADGVLRPSTDNNSVYVSADSLPLTNGADHEK